MVGNTRLSPGFRFHPTDVELVKFYLKRKVLGKKLPFHCITEIDIYKYAPWDLPLKSVLKTGDLKWYFFCPREKKYSSGSRMKRATEFGYWKTTGKDRTVMYDDVVVGMIKTLIFHQGKAPKGDRTDWVMHEYRLEDQKLVDGGVAQDSYVLSVIFKKEGPGPKNGAQYGAPFKEEEWESGDEEEVNDDAGAALWVGGSVPSIALSTDRNNSAVTSPVVPDGSCVVSPLSYPSEKTNVYEGPVCPDITNGNGGVSQAPNGDPEDDLRAAPPASQCIPQGGHFDSEAVFQAQQTVHVAPEAPGEALCPVTQGIPAAENEDDDVLAMLEYFTEEAPFTLNDLNNTEVMNGPNQVGGMPAGPGFNGNDIYYNLGDIGSLAPFGESQGLINGYSVDNNIVDYSFTRGNGHFLELMDLDTDLNGDFLPQQVDHQYKDLQSDGMKNNNNNNGCEDMLEFVNACWRHSGS